MAHPFSLRKLRMDDTQFIIQLLNDPLWLQYIGDRGIYSERDAQQYIQQSLTHFENHGYGLWVVEAYHAEPVGLCGLLNRNIFSCPDLGFAFLPQGRGKGFAHQSVNEVIGYARNNFGFSYVTAVVHPDNTPSIALLEKNGFSYYGQYFASHSRTGLRFYWLDLAN